MKPTLLIDSLSIGHAVKHAMKNYPLTKDEMHTEVIFVFLQKILSLSRRFNTSKFIFAWDSQKSFRKRISSDYKGNRKSIDDPHELFLNQIANDQFTELRRTVLPQLGFRNSFIQTGFEADDIIAQIVVGFDTLKMVIVSTDSDLHQLLSENVSQYNHISNKRLFKTDFVKKWGIEPDMWANVKAIAGCSGDNVIGLAGVGEKTAVNYLLGKMNPKTKTFKKIQENEARLYRENLPLVKLPMKGTQRMQLFPDRFSLSKFISIFNQYGFKTFLKEKNIEKWKEAFLE